MTIELSYIDIVMASVLVVVAGAISLVLRLGVSKRLSIAAVRTVVQLSALGLVLEWIFSVRQWQWVVAIAVSMVVNAGVAAVRRTDYRYAGVWSTGMIAVTVSSVMTTAVVAYVVVGVHPWYEPRYVIPLLGMVLGNSLTGIALCLERITADLFSKRREVEARLAVGATAWEAALPHVRGAIGTGMIPIINALSVAGIVSLPGMMTGQILAGAEPMTAVKYQIVVMFMIAGAATMGSCIAALLAFRSLFTSSHQLAHGRLRRLS